MEIRQPGEEYFTKLEKTDKPEPPAEQPESSTEGGMTLARKDELHDIARQLHEDPARFSEFKKKKWKAEEMVFIHEAIQKMQQDAAAELKAMEDLDNLPDVPAKAEPTQAVETPVAGWRPLNSETPATASESADEPQQAETPVAGWTPLESEEPTSASETVDEPQDAESPVAGWSPLESETPESAASEAEAVPDLDTLLKDDSSFELPASEGEQGEETQAASNTAFDSSEAPWLQGIQPSEAAPPEWLVQPQAAEATESAAEDQPQPEEVAPAEPSSETGDMAWLNDLRNQVSYEDDAQQDQPEQPDIDISQVDLEDDQAQAVAPPPEQRRSLFGKEKSAKSNKEDKKSKEKKSQKDETRDERLARLEAESNERLQRMIERAEKIKQRQEKANQVYEKYVEVVISWISKNVVSRTVQEVVSLPLSIPNTIDVVRETVYTLKEGTQGRKKEALRRAGAELAKNVWKLIAEFLSRLSAAVGRSELARKRSNEVLGLLRKIDVRKRTGGLGEKLGQWKDHLFKKKETEADAVTPSDLRDEAERHTVTYETLVEFKNFRLERRTKEK